MTSRPFRLLRSRWVWLGMVVALLAGAIGGAFLWQSQNFRARLAGEPFYRGQPTRHWREILRECGRNGRIPSSTAAQFWDAHAAFPVLWELAHDPDRNVRWPAIAVIGQHDLRTQQVLDVLVGALEDVDLDVRLEAIRGLARWGPMARPAIPALTERLHDPELPVVHHADIALWKIDPIRAASTSGWQPFTSAEFGFSAMFPAQPQRDDRPVIEGQPVGHVFHASHRTGPTGYMVVITDYPEQLLKGSTEEERFQALKNFRPSMGGKVVEEKDAFLGGLHGREFLLEVDNTGFVRGIMFWVGWRLYSVNVTYKPEFLNGPAADFFLDSFHLKGMAGPEPDG